MSQRKCSSIRHFRFLLKIFEIKYCVIVKYVVYLHAQFEWGKMKSSNAQKQILEQLTSPM